MASSSPVELRRALSLRDLVLFNLVAVIGLRWLATAAKSGPSALTLWVLAALLFFIPQGLAVSELSARYPNEGGIYAWTRRRFGEGHGFFCGWCYWIVNVLYYPQLLISSAVIATFVIGRGNSGLGESWPYVLTASLVALWLAVGLNIVGLATGKWLQNAGGIGTYLTGIILIGVWLIVLPKHPSVTPITAHALVPNFKSLDAVNLWASIAFAFAGLELAPSMGDEIHDPSRTLPRAVYISAPLIAGIYIVGTAALLWLVPTGDINIVSGFLQAIDVGAHQIGHALWWLAPLAAAAYTIGNVGGVGAWLSAPARVAFVIGLDKYFPPAFGRVHPKWGTPYVAIIVQAALATVFLLLSVLGKGTTVEKAYLILLDAQILIYFVPFIYLFLCYLTVVVPRPREGDIAAVSVTPRRIRRVLIGASGLFVTLFAMGVAMIPPSDTNPSVFEAKVLGGAGGFFLLGYLIYRRGVRATAVVPA